MIKTSEELLLDHLKEKLEVLKEHTIEKILE